MDGATEGTPVEALRPSHPEITPDDVARALVHGIPAIPYRCLGDDDSTTLFIGPQVEDALGYAVDEWLTQPDLWAEILHPDDRERVLAHWDRCRDEGLVFDIEYRLIGADGRRVWLHDRARRAILGDGTIVWQGVMVDITAARAREERLEDERFLLAGTVSMHEERIAEAGALIDLEIAERRAVEEDLRHARERLEALKGGLRESWMYTWDVTGGRATGGFNDASTMAEFGADPAEVALRGDDYWRMWLHPADAERVTAGIRTSTTTGVPFEDSYRWVTPDGRERWILDRAVATAWNAETMTGHFVGLMVDVTDLMREIRPEG